VLVVAVAALGRSTSAGQAGGVCVVAIGVLLVRGFKRNIDSRGVLFGLAIAFCIAAYTLVDKEGIRHASLIPYFELVLAGPALVYTGAVSATRGVAAIRAEITPVNVLVGLGVHGVRSRPCSSQARAGRSRGGT
jgi:drug/metabolite transporter (DMT)-like permease